MFERGYSYYGYSAEAVAEIRDLLGDDADALNFFEYTYNGQSLYWIEASMIETFDLGFISADCMAVYGQSTVNFYQM